MQEVLQTIMKVYIMLTVPFL